MIPDSECRFKIPRDDHAEQGLIGCMLQTATSDDLDPAHVMHEGRRLIVITIDLFRAEGMLQTPRTNHPGHERECGLANAELVAHELVRTKLWTHSGDIRHELRECLNTATTPALIDFYSKRLATAARLRHCISIHERRLHAAYAGDVEVALEGVAP